MEISPFLHLCLSYDNHRLSGRTVDRYFLHTVAISTHSSAIYRLGTKPSGFDLTRRMDALNVGCPDFKQRLPSQYVIGTLVIHHRLHDPQISTVGLHLSQRTPIKGDLSHC